MERTLLTPQVETDGVADKYDIQPTKWFFRGEKLACSCPVDSIGQFDEHLVGHYRDFVDDQVMLIVPIQFSTLIVCRSFRAVEGDHRYKMQSLAIDSKHCYSWATSLD